MANGKEKPLKLPKSPAQCADLLYKTRDQRLKAQKAVDKLQVLETALKEYFINNLDANVKDSTGVAGKLARVQITRDTIPTVEDWPKFYQHIKKTGSFELLQRSVSVSAVRERWDDKKEVPGVGKFSIKKVSCTKL